MYIRFQCRSGSIYKRKLTQHASFVVLIKLKFCAAPPPPPPFLMSTSKLKGPANHPIYIYLDNILHLFGSVTCIRAVFAFCTLNNVAKFDTTEK